MPDYSPSPDLNALHALQETDMRYLSSGFELSDFDDDAGLESWSTDPAFRAGLAPFAMADGSGSFYALWRIDDRADLATLPIVGFGSEGGAQVIARNLLELLRILGHDTEPSIDFERAFYYSADDEEHSERHGDYLHWLRERFGAGPDEDPDATVEAAQREYGDRFAEWMARFYKG